MILHGIVVAVSGTDRDLAKRNALDRSANRASSTRIRWIIASSNSSGLVKAGGSAFDRASPTKGKQLCGASFIRISSIICRNESSINAAAY
jgi:hypothetical protein